MTNDRQAAVCLFAQPDAAAFRRCLWSVLNHTPRDRIELRLACGTGDDLAFALGVLCPDGAAPARQALPGGVERFHWTAADGLPVWAWAGVSGPLLDDVPLESEYAVCLGRGAALEAGWWEALAPLLEQRIDLIGRPAWHVYAPGEAERLQAEPWSLGVPPERRDGQAGVRYMPEGFVVVRSERWREARGAAGVRLGAIAHQLGWTQAEHDRHVYWP